MRPISSLLIAAASLAPCAVDAATLYTNDLGTTAQFSTWKITTEGGATIERQVAAAPNYPDLDGDGASGNLLYGASGLGRVYFDKTIYAPNYTTLASPRFSATGTGYQASNGASSWVELGVDGTTYPASDQSVGNVGSNSPVPLSAQLAGAGYNGLLSVHARARLEVRSGTLPGGAGRPRMGNFKVEADINPGQVGDRVWIYKNDFGTTQAVDEWTHTGGAITASTTGTASDLDGDNLGRRIEGNATDPFSATMTVRIDAPAGYRFSNPIAQAVAGGDWTNWASRVTLAISADGVDFSEVLAQTTAGTTQLSANATGNADFEDLTTLWVRIHLQAGNSGGIRPWVQDVLVSGELTAIPEPASLLLLAAGATTLAVRRRPRDQA